MTDNGTPIREVAARPVCSLYRCDARHPGADTATVDTDVRLPSGTGWKVLCANGHVTNGVPPSHLRNRQDVVWLRVSDHPDDNRDAV